MTIYSIYFSPTGGTKKITNTLAKELGDFKEIDLSIYKDQYDFVNFSKEDICFIGVPSYGGRVPELAIERIQYLKGSHTRAILVVSYGNRDYDDTLVELYDTVEKNNFNTIAGVAAIARHSIMKKFASNRPDEEDLENLRAFSSKIREKLDRPNEASIVLKGNRPYKEFAGVPLVPSVSKTCTSCQVCAKLCPANAIDLHKPNTTNSDRCISCMRCIEVCPEKARHLNKFTLGLMSFKMRKQFKEKKENELFI